MPRRRAKFAAEARDQAADRLLSNPAIEVDDILVRWVPFVVGARRSIVAAMD
jgi:hypothetical protein